MASKRIESSKQRLQDKIEEGKRYLNERERNYETNELTRLKNNLENKKAQFEKDITEYGKADDRDEEKITEYENLQVEVENITDDIEHYLGVTKDQLQQRQIEQEKKAEEKRLQLEAEEKRLQLEAKEKRQQFELQKYEMEIKRRKQEQQYELEKLRMESDVEKEQKQQLRH